jgi:hypothetical protein
MKFKTWILAYFLALLSLCAIVAFSSACAAKSYHTAVVADTEVFAVLDGVHRAEQTVLCGSFSCAGVAARPAGAAWNDAKSQAFNLKFLVAVEAGRMFNTQLRSWKPGTPAPLAITQLINSLADSLSAIAAEFPDGTTKTKILADIGTAQSVILKAIAIVMSVKGA